MALNWPPHEFVQGNNNVVLYIEGHKLYFSQRTMMQEVIKAYFYCCNKKNDVIHCKASA